MPSEFLIVLSWTIKAATQRGMISIMADPLVRRQKSTTLCKLCNIDFRGRSLNSIFLRENCVIEVLNRVIKPSRVMRFASSHQHVSNISSAARKFLDNWTIKKSFTLLNWRNFHIEFIDRALKITLLYQQVRKQLHLWECADNRRSHNSIC